MLASNQFFLRVSGNFPKIFYYMKIADGAQIMKTITAITLALIAMAESSRALSMAPTPQEDVRALIDAATQEGLVVGPGKPKEFDFSVTVDGQKINVSDHRSYDDENEVVLTSTVRGPYSTRFGRSLPYRDDKNYLYIAALHVWVAYYEIKVDPSVESGRRSFIEGLHNEASYAAALRSKLLAKFGHSRK